MPSKPTSDLVTVLYDADCGFCQACVDWTRRRARPPSLAFFPLDSPEGRRLLATRNIPPVIDSVVFLEADDLLTKSDATLALLARCRFPWSLGRFGRWIPKPLRDGLYDCVARHRHRFSKRGCRVG